MLFSILLLFLAINASEDSRSLTAVEMLKDAIATYANSPLCTIKGSITVMNPYASRTHAKLSSLLRIYPEKNAYKKTLMINFVTKLKERGYCDSSFTSPYHSVQSTFHQIYDCCGIARDGENIHKNKGWIMLLALVQKVFNKYAPTGIKTLVNYDEAHNFLLFLLVHYKLNYERIVPEATEENNPPESIMIPLSLPSDPTYISPTSNSIWKTPASEFLIPETAESSGELYFNGEGTLERKESSQVAESQKPISALKRKIPSSSQEGQHKKLRTVTEPYANGDVIFDLFQDSSQLPFNTISDIPVPISDILDLEQLSDQVNQEETHSDSPGDKEESVMYHPTSNSIYDDLPTEYKDGFSYWY